MKLPDNLREKFKVPLGQLIPEKNVNKETLLEKIPKDSFVITVGDATTEKMINYGIVPSLQIVDGQEKRIKRELPSHHEIKTSLNCDNPQGEISTQSIHIIQVALKLDPPVRILVNGEEDLLVIPVCIFAPENAIVMYGQPNEGLVFVRLDKEIRNKTKELLELME